MNPCLCHLPNPPRPCPLCGPEETEPEEPIPADCPKCGMPLLRGQEGGSYVWVCLHCQHIQPTPGTGDSQKPLAATEKRSAPTDGQSDGEVAFLRYWRMLAADLPAPVEEYRISPDRRWKIDFCWPGAKVALEIDGWGHTKQNRYFSDIDKYNALASMGYRLFRTTRQLMESNPAGLVGMLREAITCQK